MQDYRRGKGMKINFIVFKHFCIKKQGYSLENTVKVDFIVLKDFYIKKQDYSLGKAQ